MTLWLLKGEYEAPGWQKLEQDSKADAIDVVMFDRLAWALIEADQAPDGYEGLEPTTPPDGLYLSPYGSPAYVVNRKLVDGPMEVIEALGSEAKVTLEKVGDPDTTLERLGRVF
jgi:hypothetical protein